NRVVSNWTLHVTTGISDPPFGTRPATQPLLDLNSVNIFGGGAGGILTIKFFADGFGPLSGALSHKTGGTITGMLNDNFQATVNGVGVTSQNSGTTFPALASSVPVVAGANTTLG